MPRFYLLILVSVISSLAAGAQASRDLAVMASATVSESPKPSITIRWNRDDYAKSYQIWRKFKTDQAFPTASIASLDSTAQFFADENVIVGTGYEYRIAKHCIQQVGIDTTTKQPIYKVYDATGFLYSGIKVPSVDRGRVLVLVDTTLAISLASGLATLRTDLEAEGWTFSVRYAPRAESFDSGAVRRVRDIIREEYRKPTQDLKTLFILGHVAVAYSGMIAPDGHSDHLGAWPADVIYGDPEGAYSDVSVNKTGVRAAQVNVPKDGKFDASGIAFAPKLAVGRVDFFDMPEFAMSEVELLNQYLKKDHDFRTNSWNVRAGGFVDDNFGASGYPEAFASSGWRNMSVFGRDTSVKAGDFFGSLGGPQTYLWSYGCGGGTDVSAGGVGTTTDFATKPVNAVFTMLFGSYFGDWNTKNNFLRAPLASSPRALTSAWSGRPHWYLHHMALGECIGYSTVISQFNSTVEINRVGTYFPHLYYTSAGASMQTSGDQMVHIALMGDPTLRAQMSVIPAPAQASATTQYPNMVKLTWLAPAGGSEGYMVYRIRKNTTKLLTKLPITATQYIDSLGNEGDLTYLVRSCKLRSTASGTYYDAGRAAVVTVTTTDVASEEFNASTALSIAPNPASSDAVITVATPTSGDVVVSVHDITGRLLESWQLADVIAGSATITWNTTNVATGRYIVRMTQNGRVTTQSVAVLR